MNSSANKAWSLSRLLNRWLFPSLAAIAALAVFIPNAYTYFTLKAMIPAERLTEARHAALCTWQLTGAAMGLAILACLVAAVVIEWRVTRPLTRLARWADERRRKGEGPGMRTNTPVTEIRELARVFAELFEEQLRRVKELKILIGGTRHDIRNHLTDISSTAQFLRDDADYDRTAAAVRTLSTVKTITHIVDINAEITKNYCNIRGAPSEDVCLRDLVHDCLDGLETEAYKLGLDLDAEIPPSSLTVVAHRALLEGVIRNLTGNAFKYTPKGGSVKLSVRKDGADVVIEVADTGIGIPDADKPHVFEREFRSKRVKRQPGTGYGLASVHSVAALYEGTADVSDNKPKGTVVTVRLPLRASSSPIPYT